MLETLNVTGVMPPEPVCQAWSLGLETQAPYSIRSEAKHSIILSEAQRQLFKGRPGPNLCLTPMHVPQLDPQGKRTSGSSLSSGSAGGTLPSLTNVQRIFARDLWYRPCNRVTHQSSNIQGAEAPRNFLPRTIVAN